MVKWKISEIFDLENNKREVFVFCPSNKNECLEKQSLRELIADNGFSFNMVYHNNKMIGYHFTFSKESKVKVTDRMVFWGLGAKKKDVNISALFEDQNVRLLEFKEENNPISDYWLVGRWRDVE